MTTPQNWSVQYLVDQDVIPKGYCCPQNTPINVPPEPAPADNRGLALAPNGKHLYAGYNHGNNAALGFMEVRKLDTSGPVLEESRFDAVLYGYRGKAIAVDHRGRVYLAEGLHSGGDSLHRLVIYDADLDSQLFNFTIGVCPVSPSFPGTAGDNCLPGNAEPEGVAVVTQADPGLILWVSDRHRHTLDKFVSSNGKVTNWKFMGEYLVSAPGHPAVSLRGLAVDSMGRIWIADLDGHGVFVVTWNSSNPSTMSSSAFVDLITANPMDVGLDAVHAFVTTNGTFGDTTGSTAKPQIKVIDQTGTYALMVTMTLTPPYALLNPKINPCGDNTDGCGRTDVVGARLSGIAVTCPIKGSSTAGFYVANEAGLTAEIDPEDPNTLTNPQICTGASGEESLANTCDRDPIIQAVAGEFAPCPGCGKTNGGGQIAVTGPPPGYATFGFEVQQKSGNPPKGQLEYLDHTSGANYHSVTITSLMIDTSGTMADFKGTIVQKDPTMPCTGASPCYFEVKDQENGESHPTMDMFQITICTGAPCGSGPPSMIIYSQGGTIRRGDIEVHQCKKDDD